MSESVVAVAMVYWPEMSLVYVLEVEGCVEGWEVCGGVGSVWRGVWRGGKCVEGWEIDGRGRRRE
jgi:hypothetical protein